MEVEAQGYREGSNPMFGEFTRVFPFSPLTFRSKERRYFRSMFHQAVFDIKYCYYGEVKIDITLYFEERKRFESLELGDLDNYAKSICDCLKGPKGLLIDDSQVQALSIIWIDTVGNEYFEIRMRGHPDEFIMKPIEFYEMPDHLFYPVSNKSWTIDGVRDISSDEKESLLALLYGMIRNGSNFRNKLVKVGVSISQAFQQSRAVMPILRGFHEGRIVDWRPMTNVYRLEAWTDSIKSVNATHIMKQADTLGD